MGVTAISGINWGDEGKGRMVDYFSKQADYVIRYQGGNNAGHTVINNYGKFALHHLPSGVFSKNDVPPGSDFFSAGTCLLYDQFFQHRLNKSVDLDRLT